MSSHEDLGALCGQLEAIHERLCRLEENRAMPLKNVLTTTEDLLRICTKVQNYETTIKEFVDQLNEIDGMCRQPNPDWLAIVSKVLSVLSLEGGPKEERTEQLLKMVEDNMQVLDAVKRTADLVEEDRRSLGMVVSLHSIDDVRKAVDMVRNYQHTVHSVEMKYQLIMQKIRTLRWDIPTLVSVTLEIIQIVEEEDIVKKQRDEMLFPCFKQSVEALMEATARISQLHVGSKYGGTLETDLGSPFSLVLGSLNTVVQGVNAVIHYQDTIDEIYAKYDRIRDSLQRLASVSDIKQVIPTLLEFVHTLHEEDSAKAARIELLVKQMREQESAIRGLTGDLQSFGMRFV